MELLPEPSESTASCVNRGAPEDFVSLMPMSIRHIIGFLRMLRRFQGIGGPLRVKNRSNGSVLPGFTVTGTVKPGDYQNMLRTLVDQYALVGGLGGPHRLRAVEKVHDDVYRCLGPQSEMQYGLILCKEAEVTLGLAHAEKRIE